MAARWEGEGAGEAVGAVAGVAGKGRGAQTDGEDEDALHAPHTDNTPSTINRKHPQHHPPPRLIHVSSALVTFGFHLLGREKQTNE
jgi:hypothetical protein